MIAMGYIVMGVSGSGKTSVGKALADELGCAFIEGDDYHPAANLEKMRSGHALTDEDRLPWLYRLADQARFIWQQQPHWVMSCSALKPSYRDIFRALENPVRFVFLDVPAQTLLSRLNSRHNHFMPAQLLQSQLDTLSWREHETDIVHVSGNDAIAEQIIQIMQHRDL